MALAVVFVGTGVDATEATGGSEPAEDWSDGLPDHCRDHEDVRVTSGSTGRIEISDSFVGGTFYLDDTILRTGRCVAHLEGPDERRAPAGVLTVGSNVGVTAGEPPASLAINPDASNDYFEFPDPPLFNYPDRTQVAIQLSGAAGFPAIHHRKVRPSPFEAIAFAQPLVPQSGVVSMASTASFAFDWTVPQGAKSATQQSITASVLVLGQEAWGHIYCSWPLAAGHGDIPVTMLHELRARLGGTGAVDGALDIFSGEYREVTTATSSYVILVGSDLPQTSIPRSTPVRFE